MVKRAHKIQKIVKRLHQRYARIKQFATEWGLIMKKRKVIGNIPNLEGVVDVSNLLLLDVQLSHDCLVNTMSAVQQGHVLCPGCAPSVQLFFKQRSSGGEEGIGDPSTSSPLYSNLMVQITKRRIIIILSTTTSSPLSPFPLNLALTF